MTKVILGDKILSVTKEEDCHSLWDCKTMRHFMCDFTLAWGVGHKMRDMKTIFSLICSRIINSI